MRQGPQPEMVLELHRAHMIAPGRGAYGSSQATARAVTECPALTSGSPERGFSFIQITRDDLLRTGRHRLTGVYSPVSQSANSAKALMRGSISKVSAVFAIGTAVVAMSRPLPVPKCGQSFGERPGCAAGLSHIPRKVHAQGTHDSRSATIGSTLVARQAGM